MCIRYSTIDERWERWIRRKNIWVPIQPPKAEEPGLFPGGVSLIVRPSEEHGRELITAKWGLQPPGAKDPNLGRRYGYNARKEGSEERGEGIENMRMFGEPFRNRRCLVPAACFFERVGPKGAQRWLRISAVEAGEPLLFPGPLERAEPVDRDPDLHDRDDRPTRGLSPRQDTHRHGSTTPGKHGWPTTPPLDGLREIMNHGPIEQLRIEDFGPVEYKPRKEKAGQTLREPKLAQEKLF